jgi:DNA repair ATPase RecN
MIEQIFESLLGASPKFKEAMQSLEKLLQNIAQMAKTLFDLSQLVQAHNEAIHEIMAGYQSMISLLQALDPLSTHQFTPDTELN